MKASSQRNTDYLGKVELWFSPNRAQERVIWEWLEQQKAAGIKLAPAIKAILYQSITGAGQGGQVESQLADIKSMLARLSSGQIAYGPEVAEEANDLLDKLGRMNT